MRFILHADALRSLAEIRHQYEGKKNIILCKKQSAIGMPTFFGGTDVDKRAKQIGFIEKILLVMNKNLISEEDDMSELAQRSNLTASRMIIAACLYVQGQITHNCTVLSGKRAVLHQLINQKLGITDSNFLDPEDRAICCNTAYALSALPNALEEVNDNLHNLGVDSITYAEWSDFKAAMLKEYSIANTKDSVNHYPFTSITKPAFGTVFSHAGLSLGILCGGIASKSTQLMPTRYYISAGISSIALTLHTANPIGISIIAPILANHLLEYFCETSLGHAGALTFNILGQGVGTMVGLPLDLAYYLSLKTYEILKESHSKRGNNQNLTGLRISDGLFMVNNIAIGVQESPTESPAEIQTIRIEKDGSIYINETLASYKIDSKLFAQNEEFPSTMALSNC